MIFKDITNGKGPNVLLLSKENGEYAVFAQGDKIVDILIHLVKLYQQSPNNKGLIVEQFIEKYAN